MATTAGALSKVSVQRNSASLLSGAASAGTGPYTYQWYKSTDPAFAIGAPTLISGATSLSLSDTGLDPATTYYYKVRATDSGSVTGDSAALTVTTAAALPDQNQFKQSQVLGQVSGQPTATFSAQVASTVVTALLAGQAVKIVDDASALPQVVACAADSDEVWGFINYDIKSQNFKAGDRVEVSMGSNLMLLQATGPVARGERVCLDVLYIGGVAAYSLATSGDTVVGFAYDKAAAAQLIRVRLGARSIVK